MRNWEGLTKERDKGRKNWEWTTDFAEKAPMMFGEAKRC